MWIMPPPKPIYECHTAQRTFLCEAEDLCSDVLFHLVVFQSLHADTADSLFHAFHVHLSDTTATDITGCPDSMGVASALNLMLRQAVI